MDDTPKQKKQRHDMSESGPFDRSGDKEVVDSKGDDTYQTNSVDDNYSFPYPDSDSGDHQHANESSSGNEDNTDDLFLGTYGAVDETVTDQSKHLHRIAFNKVAFGYDEHEQLNSPEFASKRVDRRKIPISHLNIVSMEYSQHSEL
jgi:hypothetical protein